MALTEAEAKQKAMQRIHDSHSTRVAYEALCGLWMVYAYGNQWSHLGSSRRGGRYLRQLRPMVDPDRGGEVRVAINEIRPRIEKMNSRMEPQKLEFEVRSASPATNDRVAARVGQKRLEVFAHNVRALKKLQQRVRWETVLGSVIIRRSIGAIGPVVKLKDAMGEDVLGKNGQVRTIRTFQHGWQVGAPYEYIRDPSANSIDFDGEDCIGQEKPVLEDYILRHFGRSAMPKEGSKATMGDYMSMQEFIYRATGQTLGARPMDSKAKAFLLSEWWFRDPENERENDWPYWMLAFRDAYGQARDARDLQVLQFGPNPYQGLPLHHYVYDAPPGHAWGSGIPQQGVNSQNMLNLAMTGFIRTLLLQCGTPVVIDKEAIEGKIEEIWSRRYSMPILTNTRQGRPWPPVHRLSPPQFDQVAGMFIQQASQWMDSALNMAPVQRGITSRRGEAGRAVQLKQEQADTPITARITRDKDTTDELLTGTLYDIARTSTLKQLKHELSGEFADVELATLRSQDFAKAGIGVYVSGESMRPRTPRERREEAMALVQSQILEPAQARRAILVRTGEGLDPLEEMAYKFQEQENRLLLAGQEADVEEGHLHELHIFATNVLMNGPAWALYSPKQKKAIREHLAGHLEYTEAAEMTAQPEAPPQPQAPEAQLPAFPEQYPPPTESPGPVIPFPQVAPAPGIPPAPVPAEGPGAGLVQPMAV